MWCFPVCNSGNRYKIFWKYIQTFWKSLVAREKSLPILRCCYHIHGKALGPENVHDGREYPYHVDAGNPLWRLHPYLLDKVAPYCHLVWQWKSEPGCGNADLVQYIHRFQRSKAWDTLCEQDVCTVVSHDPCPHAERIRCLEMERNKCNQCRTIWYQQRSHIHHWPRLSRIWQRIHSQPGERYSKTGKVDSDDSNKPEIWWLEKLKSAMLCKVKDFTLVIIYVGCSIHANQHLSTVSVIIKWFSQLYYRLSIYRGPI